MTLYLKNFGHFLLLYLYLFHLLITKVSHFDFNAMPQQCWEERNMYLMTFDPNNSQTGPNHQFSPLLMNFDLYL